jgi:tol-pal system beta propeller repeat protein TolB
MPSSPAPLKKVVGMTRTVLLSATVVLALVAACMAALVVAVVKPAEAAFPGRNGKIAFSSPRAGNNYEIYVMKPNGSGVQRLIVDSQSPPATDLSPAWSADGTRIAFTRDFDIYSMNAYGSNRTQLTNNSDTEYSPAWSPYGSKIAYIRDLPAGEGQVSPKIHVMNADGSEQHQLTNTPYGEANPAWSPDGSKIAFVAWGVGGEHVYTVNADGSGLTKLTRDGSYTKHHPDWSPDGSKIVFARYERGTDVPYDIIVMNSDGTGKKNITNSPAISEVHPAWSPDGRQIVYSRFPGWEQQNSEIWRMRANGTRRVQLTEKPTTSTWGDSGPSWQPLP